jgi:hypothetical protein
MDEPPPKPLCACMPLLPGLLGKYMCRCPADVGGADMKMKSWVLGWVRMAFPKDTTERPEYVDTASRAEPDTLS